MKTISTYARSALSVVMTIVIVAVIGTSLAFIVPGMFGFERYAITGGSMSGTFERGSVAFDKNVPVADLHVGDIITYRPPAATGVNGLVTHRIVEISDGAAGPRFRTKGDANAAADPWTFQLGQGLQPRLAYTIPYVGYAILGLADRNTRMLAIGVPAGVVALISLLKVAGAVGGSVRPRTANGRHRTVSACGPPPTH